MHGAWQWGVGAGAILLIALGLGWWVGSSQNVVRDTADRSQYSYGYVSEGLYDRAYSRVTASERDVRVPVAGLVAHHLLVASDIAQVWEELRGSVPASSTIVLLSPNHFGLGFSPAQISFGKWETPYGDVATDLTAARVLLDGIPFLQQEEHTARKEHGIAVETPFVARSFPDARFVPIILDESLSAEQAWELGEQIATLLPDAVVVASIDMVHGQPADVTAAEDARILGALEEFSTCRVHACLNTFMIDSNASLRALWAFVIARGGREFLLTHHGSSMEMGATDDSAENVSHVLGLFL